MWAKDKWVMIGLFIAIALAAIALLVVGITTHEEPGLIEGVPQWERSDFPLRVCPSTYPDLIPTPDHSETVWTTVEWINTRLGFRAFRIVGTDCDVTVVIDAPIEPGWRDPGGHSQIVHTGSHAERCEVTVGGTAGAEDLTLLVVYHELGHCLGLAHDDFRLSIMYPVQEPTPDMTLPPWFSDYDRRLLRELYGP